MDQLASMISKTEVPPLGALIKVEHVIRERPKHADKSSRAKRDHHHLGHLRSSGRRGSLRAHSDLSPIQSDNEESICSSPQPGAIKLPPFSSRTCQDGNGHREADDDGTSVKTPVLYRLSPPKAGTDKNGGFRNRSLSLSCKKDHEWNPKQIKGVIGSVMEIGEKALPLKEIKVGTRVVTLTKMDEELLQPYRGCALNVLDRLVVSEASRLVGVPEDMSAKFLDLMVTSGLANYQLTLAAKAVLEEKLKDRKKCSDPVKILMVCNGGPKDKFSPLMVQVAYRLFRSASDGLADHRGSTLTIASMADDLAMWWMNNREKRCGVILWNADAYEQLLIDRTMDQCKGKADIVVCQELNQRTFLRSLSCLDKDGTLLVLDTEEARNLGKKAKDRAETEDCVQYVQGDLGLRLSSPCRVMEAAQHLKQLIFSVSAEGCCICTCSIEKTTCRKHPQRQSSN